MILHSFELENISLVESLQPGRYYLVAVADGFLLKVQAIVEADDSSRGETAMKGPVLMSHTPDELRANPNLSELVTRGLANVLGTYGN